MAVKCEITQNPNGTLNLEIKPEDLLAEYERQLQQEWMFLLAPIPFLFFSPKRIFQLRKTIRDHKKAHGL